VIVSLPPELELAIELALKELPSSQWVKTAQELSLRYRDAQTTTKIPRSAALVTGKQEALGYVALILPATYAQLSGALQATHARIPNWQPHTLLDIGSGPGTALWAALEQWPTLQRLTAWEREVSFITLAQRLTQASTNPVLQQTQWEQVQLGGLLPTKTSHYDLIIIGHVLNELDDNLQSKVLTWAWEHCDGVLLLVEPGTSAAFPIIKRARQQLLDLGQTVHTLAPCTHDLPCPLTNDWCHFPQKLQRPEFQRRAKAASAGWEESKFSYAALSRFPAENPSWGRLLHQPHLHKAWTDLIICNPVGITRTRILKRNRTSYKQARDYEWGELLYNPLENDEDNLGGATENETSS
jgi:ribosomal protein RSM22 (predicted rRNA methylase)